MSETFQIKETTYTFNELQGKFREGEKDVVISAIMSVEALFSDEQLSSASETNLGTLERSINPRHNCIEVNYYFRDKHCGFKYRGDELNGIQVFELIEKSNFPNFITFLQRAEILRS